MIYCSPSDKISINRKPLAICKGLSVYKVYSDYCNILKTVRNAIAVAIIIIAFAAHDQTGASPAKRR